MLSGRAFEINIESLICIRAEDTYIACSYFWNSSMGTLSLMHSFSGLKRRNLLSGNHPRPDQQQAERKTVCTTIRRNAERESEN